MTDLKDRHVVITGGLGGLGIEVVRILLERGATCHVVVRSPATDETLAFAHGDRFRTIPVDATDEAAVSAFYASLPSLWASVHLAGGFAMAPITETPLQIFRAQLDINLVTAFLCCREAVRKMSGGGRIVNVTARPALSPTGGMLAYSTAKAGIASLTQCLAEEVKARGILVNAIVPSIIDTPPNRANMPKADHSLWPKPAEIAETIAFLVSPKNRLTSGALVPVYGRA